MGKERNMICHFCQTVFILSEVQNDKLNTCLTGSLPLKTYFVIFVRRFLGKNKKQSLTK